MGKYLVELTDIARLHLLQHKKSGNQASIKKISKIILELSEHPFTGVGHPEELKHQLTGIWSRKINQKDRLIYTVNDAVVTVEVLTAIGHCGDK